MENIADGKAIIVLMQEQQCLTKFLAQLPHTQIYSAENNEQSGRTRRFFPSNFNERTNKRLALNFSNVAILDSTNFIIEATNCRDR